MATQDFMTEIEQVCTPQYQLNLCLAMTRDALSSGLYGDAINHLSMARNIARRGDTQRMRAISAHATAAIQALLPKAVGEHVFTRILSVRV